MSNPISAEQSQELVDKAITLAELYPDIPVTSIKLKTPRDDTLPHLNFYVASRVVGAANQIGVDRVLDLLSGPTSEVVQSAHERPDGKYSGKIKSFGAIVCAASYVANFEYNHFVMPDDIAVARQHSSLLGQIGVPVSGVSLEISKFMSPHVWTTITSDQEREQLIRFLSTVSNEKREPDFLGAMWPGLQDSYTIELIGTPAIILTADYQKAEANQGQQELRRQNKST